MQIKIIFEKRAEVIYTILSTDDVQFVRILDINKHEY
jgi:hypothetical protein